MTTFASKHVAPVTGAPPATTVAWALSRTGEGGAATLAVTVDAQAAVATLICEGCEPVVVAQGGPVRLERAGALEHIDVPGVLSLTLRVSGGVAELLYARTPLLEALGVPGGCAERPEIQAR